MKNLVKNIVHLLSLFGSFSTLFCCALPVLFVTLGIGTTFASITAVFPQIHWVTEHKTLLFIVTGILLVISYILMKYSENLSCPIEAEVKREACQNTKHLTKWIFWIAVGMYGAGGLFSYIVPWIMNGQS